jgi:outer membrane protein assembly factor BamA
LPIFAQTVCLKIQNFVLVLLLLCCSISRVDANAQDLNESKKKVKIRSIHFHGNKVTKDKIILREMNIEPGDSILVDDLEVSLEFNKRRILNLQLFSRVEYCIEKWEEEGIEIEYSVNEIFFWIPKPIFSLADRNFNVWWVDNNHRLDRTNLGIELSRLNFRGRNETLVAMAQVGYNKEFNLSYRVPYVDKKLRYGLYAGLTYSTGREINYKTNRDKQEFYNNEQYPYNYFQARVATTYRKSYASIHELRLSYSKYTITSALFNANPEFLGGKTRLNFLELKYHFKFNNTDTRVYPTNGLELDCFVSKKGLGIDKDVNQLQIYSGISYYKKLTHSLSTALVFRGRLGYGGAQPFIFQRALGYKSDYVRGYEYYVIDGSHYGLFRTNLRYKIIDRVVEQNIVKLMKYIPFRLYAKVFDDLGYARNDQPSNSRLGNSLLHGYGIGLDLVISYYAKFRIEYSFNHLRQNALFLHGTNE